MGVSETYFAPDAVTAVSSFRSTTGGRDFYVGDACRQMH